MSVAVCSKLRCSPDAATHLEGWTYYSMSAKPVLAYAISYQRIPETDRPSLPGMALAWAVHSEPSS